MIDREYRKEYRASVEAGAEALRRAFEEVANLTVEENEGRRERLVSLLNTVGESFTSIGDQIAKDYDADETAKADESRQEASDREAARTKSNDPRVENAKAGR
jgi:CHASE3 domain sensor protein